MSESRKKDRFYYNTEFLSSPEGRSIRILSEYYGPKRKLKKHKIDNRIVFFGSARISPKSKHKSNSKNIEQKKLNMGQYYLDAQTLSKKLTEWSMKIKDPKRRYIICSGGGPGIMEAANRGAAEAGGQSIGLTISLPYEATKNEFISQDLNIKFHYFFMRKFWFLYSAKAFVVWPGGFGTLDELMELLTLIQTRKIKKRLPIILYGKDYWKNVINWKYLVDIGTISKEDLKLFHISDEINDSYTFITSFLEKQELEGPNF